MSPCATTIAKAIDGWLWTVRVHRRIVKSGFTATETEAIDAANRALTAIGTAGSPGKTRRG